MAGATEDVLFMFQQDIVQEHTIDLHCPSSGSELPSCEISD